MNDNSDNAPGNPLPVVPGAQEAEEAAPVAEWTAQGAAPSGPVDAGAIRVRITEVLREVYDPEIPVNIYDLGLIYGIDIANDGAVDIRMTLTAPGCPVADYLVKEVAERTGQVEGVRVAHVELTWDPPWTMERMSDEAKLELGML